MPREILVVDDDADICDALSEVLEDDGYRVSTAASGQEAINYLRDRADDPPGLILLDLMMPVMNGVEFLDAYKEARDLPVVPVVVLSANAAFTGNKHRRDIMLYLSKPVDIPRLLATVQMWCA
jgi:two-component system, OmpR family, response regulator CpxR